ncbi:hypothetical protein Kpho02_07830 [Kitasatospora phosalacinea]|uniref:Uncharacterized protein n=1 Tax=Kitasatospora phosalacinea TaxID=2065 RepID=A0A9W6Q4L6_9ACTN|nr:hypothetical protein [Kitasatospora phosalacinea]GLW68484.1 hypothetical protein Kpho02_07830 [Kitasatospora phosalacinea]
MRFPRVPEHHRRRTGVLLAAASPPVLIGLGLLSTGAGHEDVCAAAGLAVLAVSLLGLAALRAGRARTAAAGLCGLALLLVPGWLLTDQLRHHRGVLAEVTVTGAHRTDGLFSAPSWACDVRRTDGRPLAHPVVPRCGPSDLGTTVTLLVDPDGWLPPASAERSNWDDPSPAPDLALTALALTAWARITLRTTAPARPAEGARGAR